MQRLTQADYRRMPWRSGGGTTTELVIEPRDADLGGRFLYRVSIADVASDGPFSTFDGYDRHIILLSGAGMTLDCGAHGSIALEPFEPHAFAGEWAVTGRLASGPVRDFNLIVERARAESSLEVRVVDGSDAIPLDGAGTRVVYVAEGALAEADAGDTLVADEPVVLSPRMRTRIVVARIVPLR